MDRSNRRISRHDLTLRGMIAAIVVAMVLGVSIVHSEPRIDQRAMFPADPGKKCYDGTCGDCEKSCEQEVSRSQCYLCCMENCVGNDAIKCQGYCDDEYGDIQFVEAASDPAAAAAWLRETMDKINRADFLSTTHMRRLELIWLRCPEDAPRRTALAMYGEAWGRGLAPAEMMPEVADAVRTAFVHGDWAVTTAALFLMEDGNLTLTGPDIVARCLDLFTNRCGLAGDDQFASTVQRSALRYLLRAIGN